MLTFIDRHVLLEVPAEIRYQMHLEAVHGVVDESGAVPLGHWIEDSYMYCVLAGPDQDAVCQHHLRRGLPCDEIHPITGLRGVRPLTGTEEQRVRARINELWHVERAAR